ncbi:MAG: YiiD C-terminal domain-containing protein [Verrucomicrobia bacterium]|nr:YiiD C-terminal domain-containing protein [Verrucomicrobiota bacterium]
MTPPHLQRYLHEHIPLTAAMAIRVVSCGVDAVHLSAPLSPNINHRNTVFGGSASALAIVSAWSVVHLCLQNTPHAAARIVIQNNSMAYNEPIDSDFAAISPGPDRDQWQHFLKSLQRKGIGRIKLRSTIFAAGSPAAQFEGTFVAIAPR